MHNVCLFCSCKLRDKQNHFLWHSKTHQKCSRQNYKKNAEPSYKPETQYSELCIHFQTAIIFIIEPCVHFYFLKVHFFEMKCRVKPTHSQRMCAFSVRVGSATLATVWQEVEWNQEGHLVICTINQYRYRCRRHRKLLEWEKWEALECICIVRACVCISKVTPAASAKLG